MPEVIINGPAGRLEARFTLGTIPHAPMGLILHPHPQHGGSMNNKVVYALYQTFTRRGYSALRLNFRGVGRSQGSYDRGEGELADAAAALDWLQANNPNGGPCWVAGVSFGGWIGMQLLMRRPEIEGFITVSPPANQFDFSFLAPCPSSGLIVRGERDEMVPAAAVNKLVTKLSSQKDIRIDHKVVPEASHFFVKRTDALAVVVDAYLENAIVKASPPPPPPEPTEVEPVEADGGDDDED